MESTGKYWIPIYNILEPTCKIVLAHPKYVKAIRGKKTDKKDAKWIADIFKHDLVSGSFIPPADIRQLNILAAGNRQSGKMETAVPEFRKPAFRLVGNHLRAFSHISVVGVGARPLPHRGSSTEQRPRIGITHSGSCQVHILPAWNGNSSDQRG